MTAELNIDSRRCILQPIHRPRPGSYTRVGVCMRLGKRHAEFAAYIAKKTRPAWRIRLGADCPA
jgi:hypothetical protein